MVGERLRAIVNGNNAESEADAGGMLSTYQLKRRVDGLDTRMDMAESDISTIKSNIADMSRQVNSAISTVVDINDQQQAAIAQVVNVNAQQQSAIEKLGAFTAEDYDQLKADYAEYKRIMAKHVADVVSGQSDQNAVTKRNLEYLINWIRKIGDANNLKIPSAN